MSSSLVQMYHWMQTFVQKERPYCVWEDNGDPFSERVDFNSNHVKLGINMRLLET